MRGMSRESEVPTLMAVRGDHMTVFLRQRDPASTLSANGRTVVRLWSPPRISITRFYEDDLDLVPQVAWKLARGGFDRAHAFAPAFGWAAAKARRLGGPPYTYSFRGPLTRRWLVDRGYRLEMMRATVEGAQRCIVDDEETATALRRYLLRDAEVGDAAA